MKKFLILFLVSILIITGCGPKEKENNGDNNGNNNEEPVKESLKILDVNSETRPVAVMINNHKAAQPNHAGLQDAFIVYEIIVEGGITRMMAVFKDKQTAKIGSVRSARHYFMDYALENDAVYIHFGGSYLAYDRISNDKIEDVDGMNDSGFWRDKTLKVSSEHTAFTSMANINTAIGKKKYRTTSDKKLLLNYSAKEIDLSTKEGTLTANTVVIPYSSYNTIKYTYDAANKVYKRFINDKAHTDGITKAQYTTKNIIIIKVNNYTVDKSNNLQELENVGNGTGYYITNGYVVPINWSKESHTAQTVYRYTDGKEIDVNDGNTYIQIQPSNKSAAIN